MEIQTSFRARYQETDKMGIIHHSVYPIWYECARNEWIREFGISYEKIEKMGIMLPLLSLESKYIKYCENDDLITLKAFVSKATKTRLNFKYEVYKNSDLDNVVALGETRHVWTDTNLKPINIKKCSSTIYNKLNDILKIE